MLATDTQSLFLIRLLCPEMQLTCTKFGRTGYIWEYYYPFVTNDSNTKAQFFLMIQYAYRKIFFCSNVDSKATYDNEQQASTVSADYNPGNHYCAWRSFRIPTEEWNTCPYQTWWAFRQVLLWQPYVARILCSITVVWTRKWGFNALLGLACSTGGLAGSNAIHVRSR